MTKLESTIVNLGSYCEHPTSYENVVPLKILPLSIYV